MGAGAAYAVLSMQQAVADSGLEASEVSHPRTGLIAGSGGPSTYNLMQAADITRTKGPKRIGPYMVPRCMSSTVSACIATFFAIKASIIRSHRRVPPAPIASPPPVMPSAMGNKTSSSPGGAKNSTGRYRYYLMPWCHVIRIQRPNPNKPRAPMMLPAMVSSSLAAAVWWCSKNASAPSKEAPKSMAKLSGAAANSDGFDMVAPSGEGAVRCMNLALKGYDGNGFNQNVDYINTHGTSTPVGDIQELDAIKKTFAGAGYFTLHLINQIPHRTFARRHRRPRSHLHAINDARWLHRRQRQPRKPRPRNRCHPHSRQRPRPQN